MERQTHDTFEVTPAARDEVERWMATLAHELRDPLNAVVLALRMLPDAPAGGVDAAVAHDMAGRAARQMSRIIEDVLELCRHRHGRPPAAGQEEIDLNDVIASAVNTARPVLAEKGQRLSVHTPHDKIPLHAHRCRAERVVTNLLLNAANYTGPGGQIGVFVQPAQGAVVVRVRDNGVGIAARHLPYVFDCYNRGGMGHGGVDGLGIGLSLVKRMMELQGGTVSAFSEGAGRGSEFAVRFPSK